MGNDDSISESEKDGDGPGTAAGESPAEPTRARGWLTAAGGLSKNIAVIVGIVSGLSAISGAAWSLFEFARAMHERTRFEQVSQLTTYASFGELLKRYHQIEEVTDNFMRQHRKDNWDLPALLEKYGTGASIYYSPELKDFREIHRFYEELGALIHFDAVDFELVYQLISFPTDFLESTRPLQVFVRDHWFELRKDPAKRALKDFGCNFEELNRVYERRRTDPSFKWGPEVENVCS